MATGRGWRRRLLVCGVAMVAAVSSTTLYVWERGRDHVTRQGDLVLLRSGEDPLRLLGLLDDYPRVDVGVGFAGTLTLVGGRCFGLSQVPGGGEAVLAWPDDTRVARRGGDLGLVTSGTFVPLGAEVQGGASVGRGITRSADDLPPACGAEVVEFALDE